MAVTYSNHQSNVLKRFDELVAAGKSEAEALLILKVKKEKFNLYRNDATSISVDGVERLFLGSFANAIKALRAGKKVRRSDARWFLAMVDERICMYALDGANNPQFKGLATFTSPDVLAYDWEIKR